MSVGTTLEPSLIKGKKNRGCSNDSANNFMIPQSSAISNAASASKPLKIPQAKTTTIHVKVRVDSITNSNTSTSSRAGQSSSFGSSSFFYPPREKEKLHCFDSQQIFPIECSFFQCDGSLTFAGLAANNDSGTVFTGGSSTPLANEELGGPPREGTSSGFNSDLEDGDSSPFYSSDIDSDTDSEPPLLWNFADYFANLSGNDWCVRIPQSFIDDEFNLFELPNVFKCALTLTDEPGSSTDEAVDYTFDDLLDFISIEDLTEDPISKLSQDMLDDSVLLYKLIHQRFIMTKAGLQAMWERFDKHAYGTCPRYYCHDQALLPLGPSALPAIDSVRVYCLNCQDLYTPLSSKHSKMDGVPFGPSFAHFFVRTVLYSNHQKAIENRKGEHDWLIYVPKIYGFRVFRPTEQDKFNVRTERPLDFK